MGGCCVLFWPGMTKQIEDFVSNCFTCNIYQKNKLKEYPWEKLGCDLLYFKGSNYLIVVDYFSKFVEIAKLVDNTSSMVIE